MKTAAAAFTVTTVFSSKYLLFFPKNFDANCFKALMHITFGLQYIFPSGFQYRLPLRFQFGLIRPDPYTHTPYILLFDPVKSPAYSLCSTFTGDFCRKI